MNELINKREDLCTKFMHGTSLSLAGDQGWSVGQPPQARVIKNPTDTWHLPWLAWHHLLTGPPSHLLCRRWLVGQTGDNTGLLAMSGNGWASTIWSHWDLKLNIYHSITYLQHWDKGLRRWMKLKSWGSDLLIQIGIENTQVQLCFKNRDFGVVCVIDCEWSYESAAFDIPIN